MLLHMRQWIVNRDQGMGNCGCDSNEECIDMESGSWVGFHQEIPEFTPSPERGLDGQHCVEGNKFAKSD
ncbi:hypothetical protein CEXT_219351 [Caerostris extrusa]|uniref:Uncharacterized protein n=1 Tax=Caerostris extrusa TaxID=172846 RepID=A0AAV4UHQ2_CAEEX|nr:hypothetical protein CEXT_219351 [Caerostris extrusa]